MLSPSSPRAVGAVFLSYASQDAEAAKRICESLRQASVEVWFDQNELAGGDAWDAKIRRQIASCALFVPVISASTQARLEGYFRVEWKLAAQRTHAMADEKTFLLPVVIDDTRDADAKVPAEFKAVQWTRLCQACGGQVRDDASVAAFARRVATVLGAEPAGTPDRAVAVGQSSAEIGVSRPGEGARPVRGPRRVKPWLAALAAVLVLGVAGAVGWGWQHGAKLRRVHETMVPEIERLIAAKKLGAAFDVAVAAEREAPGDAALQKLWPLIAVTTSVETTPPGAEVAAKGYYNPKSEWRHLGKTPLRDVRLPIGYTRWKIEKEGHAPLERALGAGGPVRFELDATAAIPADMVKVGAGNLLSIFTGFASVKLEAFLIDRYEVTNRQFKAFVDQQGYGKSEFWIQPFVRGGKALSREAALAEFRDSTGQPGPATWKNGTYAEGEADFPVTGVSWFEAAAYAQFVGKRLPSVYHWRVAAQVAEFESLVPLSNLGSRGLARVGTYQGMSLWGAYDLAGNAKEWCLNSGGGETRYVLGGGWREPSYLFAQKDAQSPFDRSATYGFRCMKLIDSAPLPPQVDAELALQLRNYAEERPVSDEVYGAFKNFYSYDKSALEARVEAVDEADPRWRRERVSFRAAYGAERVPAYLFLPKNSAPPLQAVIYFPSGDAFNWTARPDARHSKSNDDLADMSMVAMLVGSGRAVVYPIYLGTHERYVRGPASGALSAFRDQLVSIAKDLSRTIDYLETRPDFQPGKLAFVGYSAGGTNGTILPAMETRLKASVLVAGGFTQGKSLPESDPINFAPRNTVPTLMLNGRYDFQRPVETSQLPMFRLLGAPPEQKRHVLFDTGHTLKPEQIAGEVYVWLDRYLGLVK